MTEILSLRRHNGVLRRCWLGAFPLTLKPQPGVKGFFTMTILPDDKTLAVLRQIDKLDTFEAKIVTDQGTFHRLHLGEVEGNCWLLDVTDLVDVGDAA